MAELISSFLDKYKELHPKKQAPTAEYQYLVGEAAKMCGMRYMAMHARLKGIPLNLIRNWVYESQKETNQGRAFNGRLKRLRIRNDKAS